MDLGRGQPLLPGSSAPDAALKLTHPDADSALRVSQAWKGSAESHKSPEAPVIAVLLSSQG